MFLLLSLRKRFRADTLRLAEKPLIFSLMFHCCKFNYRMASNHDQPFQVTMAVFHVKTPTMF